MFACSSMKTLFKIVLATALIAACQFVHAAEEPAEDGALEQLLDSNRDARKLEGVVLRLARPIIKRTPMCVIVEDIDMMVSCPIGKHSKQEGKEFAEKAGSILKEYTLVQEINDELSRMFIYVHGINGNRFSELVLYITSPDPAILFFKGDFTAEDLMEVGKLSEEDRSKRIKMKEQGQEDYYLKHIK